MQLASCQRWEVVLKYRPGGFKDLGHRSVRLLNAFF